MYRVLIVHDEEIMRKSLSRAISWKSFKCELQGNARNGREAYDICSSSMPDIIILDSIVSEMTAQELVHRVHGMDKEVRMIVLSGYGNAFHKLQARELGAKDFLMKPVRKQTMEDAISKQVRELEEMEIRRDWMKTDEVFTRAQLLHLLSFPEDTATLLSTFRPVLRRAPDALLVRSEDSKALAALEKRYSLEPMLATVNADNEQYSIYLAPSSKDAAKAGRKTSTVFMGKADTAVARLRGILASSQHVSIITKNGTEAEIPVSGKYLRRLGMLTDNLAMALEGDLGTGTVLSLLSLEEARDAFLSFVIEREDQGNTLLYDAVKTASGAATAKPFTTFLDALPDSCKARERFSYPVRLMKEYLERNDESISLKRFSSQVLFMDPSYLQGLFVKETGHPFPS